MSDILSRIQKIIAKKLNVDEQKVTPEASLVDDLGADSLDTVEVVMSFEEEFDIEIPDEDAQKMRTIKNILDYVTEKTSAQ